MAKAKEGISVYNNGATSRRKNKKISLTATNDGFLLNFAFADGQPDKPAVHSCIKGKVRVSQIHLSEEALYDVCVLFMEYKKNSTP